MTDTKELLAQGIAALKSGQKARGRRLLEQLIQQDAHNEMAWLWLSGAVDTNEERRACLEHVLAINPSNGVAKQGLDALTATHSPANPSQSVGEIKPRPPKSATLSTKQQEQRQAGPIAPPTKLSPSQPLSRTKTRACPFCAEEIQASAKVCKHCGKDLTKDPPEILVQKRVKLIQRQAQFEGALADWESHLQRQTQFAQQAGSIWTRVVWIFIGLLLAPSGLGIIIIILAVGDIIARSAKRRQAEGNQSKARKEIETIRKQIVDIKTELSILG